LRDDPGRRDGGAVIRVLIAEDQAMVRGALRALLSREPDIEIVAEAARGEEVLAAALANQPDVALLDIEMPGGSGLEAAADLRRSLPSCRSLILTTFGRPGFLRRGLEAGAMGFLLKDAPPEDLARAIRRTAVGERVVDPDLAAAAITEGASPLTERERQVLAATHRGAAIPEIARTLFLSEGTVRNHLSTAIQKLYARNRAAAARIAEEKGWL
jgi:two-component system response regulator DesR